MNAIADSGKQELLIGQLIDLLRIGNAHASFDKAVQGVSMETVGTKIDKLPYTIWQLVEHIRIAQNDILEFSKGPDYQSPKWPDAYWPNEKAPADKATWQKSLAQIGEDREQFINLLRDDEKDIFAIFRHGTGQSLLKEGLVLADHNSYHTGEIIMIRRLLDDWK